MGKYQESTGLTRIADITTVCLFAAISLAAYFYFRNLNLDDAFITYRMAENAAKGLGLVYNAGERTLVSTTPLYLVVLAALGAVHLNIPDVGAVLGGLGLFGSACFLYLWVRKSLGFVAGLTSAVLLIGFPLLLMTVGMETPIYLMFAMGALYFYFNGRLTLATVFLALTTLTRADGIILAFVILLHYIWTHRKLPIRQLFWFVALAVPWFVFAWLYFGSPVPNTLGAKMAHGQSFWWSRHFLEGAQVQAVGYYRTDPLFLLFGVLGLFALTRRDLGSWVLFGWAILYSAAYALLGVPEFHWYYAPLLPAIVVATAMGTTRLPRALFSILGQRPGQGVKVAGASVSLLLLAILGWVIGRFDAGIVPTLPDSRYGIYREAGLWLDSNTTPEATAAMVEIGITGYYSKRKIIDIIGLTHPDTASRIAVNDFTYAFRHYEPDYVIVTPSALVDVQTAPWFGEKYIPIKYLQDARFGAQPLMIYHKTDGSPPSAENSLEASFDGKVGMRGFTILPKAIRPGDNLRLNLAMVRQQASSRGIVAFASLVDRNGRAWGQTDVILKPEGWQESVVGQHLDIYVSPTTPPGKYELQAGMYYLPAVDPLPIKRADKPTADRIVLGSVKVKNQQDIGKPSNSLDATLGGKFSLLGYDVAVDQTGGLKKLRVGLFWRAKETMEQDYTVFIHLLDSQGKLVGQHDGQPRGGDYPTSIWDKDETVLDDHTIELSDKLPGGEYRIAVGAYYGPTGKRLEAKSEGAKVNENAILVGEIRLP